MTAVQHHVPDEYLLSYAAGGLSEAEGLLVASHAALCSSCRARVRELEALAGAVLERESLSDVSADLLERTLKSLDRSGAARSPTPRLEIPRDPVLPTPLLRYTGPYDAIKWKKAAPGIHYVQLPLDVNGTPVYLRRLQGGLRIFSHTHRATELDLVLTGGASDDRDGRKFERGDVMANDESDSHSLTIESGEDCVTLGVHGGRVKPIGFWSRIVFGYLGW